MCVLTRKVLSTWPKWKYESFELWVLTASLRSIAWKFGNFAESLDKSRERYSEHGIRIQFYQIPRYSTPLQLGFGVDCAGNFADFVDSGMCGRSFFWSSHSFSQNSSTAIRLCSVHRLSPSFSYRTIVRAWRILIKWSEQNKIVNVLSVGHEQHNNNLIFIYFVVFVECGTTQDYNTLHNAIWCVWRVRCTTHVL